MSDAMVKANDFAGRISTAIREVEALKAVQLISNRSGVKFEIVENPVEWDSQWTGYVSHDPGYVARVGFLLLLTFTAERQLYPLVRQISRVEWNLGGSWVDISKYMYALKDTPLDDGRVRMSVGLNATSTVWPLLESTNQVQFRTKLKCIATDRGSITGTI